MTGPAGLVVDGVPVVHGHPGERRPDPDVAELFPAAPAERVQGVPAGRRGPHVLSDPGLTRAQRGLVEVDHRGEGDQHFDALDDLGHRRRDSGQHLVDEPGRDTGTDQIGDQPHAPVDRHVLHDE